MENLYCQHLSIPVDFLCNLIPDCSQYQEVPLYKQMINREFNDWLETMNLEIGEGGRFFNSLPNQVYKMHIDKQLSSAHTDCVKINIIFDS